MFTKYLIRRHPIAGFFLLFLSGFPVTENKTDATWLFRGQKKHAKFVKVSSWAYLPGYQKMIVRWSVSAITIYSVIMYTKHREGFLQGIKLGFLGIGIMLMLAAVAYYQRYQHNRRVVRPILTAVAPHAGIPPNPPRPGKVLRIPLDYDTNENAVVTLIFEPTTWRADEGQKKIVDTIIKQRMGKEWTVKWSDEAFPPYATWKRTKYPPDSVRLSDIRARIDATGDGIIVIGQTIDRASVDIDLDNESPHVALSIGTGGGKSETGKSIIAQLAHKGVDVDVIDYPKRISQNWAKVVPNVTIHRELLNARRAMKLFRLDMEDRYKQLNVNEDAEFPRRVLFIEELNSLMELDREDWEANRGRKDPKRSPFVSDFLYVLFQGRAAKMHMIVVAQRLEARTTGGGAGRGQIGTKIMGRFQPQDWKMMVDTYPRPISSRKPGRAVIVTGEGNEPVQMTYLTNEEARELAMTVGTPDWGTADSVQRSYTGVIDEPELVNVNAPRYNMKWHAENKTVPLSYESLRAAKSRDAEFPSGVDKKYTIDEIKSWYRNRTRGGIVSEVAEG
jgi:hypothetical protein